MLTAIRDTTPLEARKYVSGEDDLCPEPEGLTSSQQRCRRCLSAALRAASCTGGPLQQTQGSPTSPLLREDSVREMSHAVLAVQDVEAEI